MLTRFATENRAFVVAVVLLCLLLGPLSLATHPSREDPRITIREASVVAVFPGMAAERIENLITSKLEEKIREMPEVDSIASISSNGQSLVKLTVYDNVTETAPVWADLRNKMDDVWSELPSGTVGPIINDDKGNVAMATIALTADGFENAEMRQIAKALRRAIYARGEGVRKVEFYGVEEQRVFVEFDNVRLSRLGLDPQLIVNAISQQNVILPGGRVEASGSTFYIEPTGDFAGLAELQNLAIDVPDQSTPIYLIDVADIQFAYEEPPAKPVFWNGAPAIVVAVSMLDNFDAFAFGDALQKVVSGFEAQAPVGVEFDYITWQPTEIESAILGVFNNLWQTILIVLAVVIAFLGFRTGLIVGAMVPLVMLITTLLMRVLGIELERMSLATLIIALGLLVDNAIVVAEDIRGRIERGEDRLKAAVAAGGSLSGALLAASLTTIFAFMPLMLAPGGAGEYTRSISLVIALTLFVSWIVALTVLAMACISFLKPGAAQDEDAAYSGALFQRYRGLLRGALQYRFVALLVAFATLPLGAWMFGYVDKTFFPRSERTQLQVVVELPKGFNTYATRDVTDTLTDWLLDKERNPEVVSVVNYVADGGPRFYLALSPPDGNPNNAYMIVNVQEPSDVDVMSERIRDLAFAQIPEAEIYPKPMSFGPNEAGLVEYRISGTDAGVLKAASQQLQLAMRRIDGSFEISDNWKNPTVTLKAVIDQEAARRANVSSQDIAEALNSQLSGAEVTDYRVGDVSFPVVFRAIEAQRTQLDRLRSLNVTVAGGNPVPLEQVATIVPRPEFAQVRRRDLVRTLTVSGKNSLMTAEALDAALAPELENLRNEVLPPDYRIEKGGEIEGSSDAQSALFANVPLALALIVLVLIWQFDSFKKTAIVVLTIPLIVFGVAAGLLVAPGANFSFMGILGFLALMGIVINNAIVLIDRIDIERAAGRSRNEALIEAGVRRLRPILMTTCTTAVGLLPIILSRDVLFYDLAIVIAGGLLVGTLLTLIVVPCLYTLFYRNDAPAEA